MISKFAEIEIPQDDPFKNDKLDRKEIAENLTRLISTVEEPLVMSVAARWGTGKTTFIKMWQQMLHNEGYYSLYFNAWKTDFVSDPLIAFIQEISALIEDHEAEEVRCAREVEPPGRLR